MGRRLPNTPRSQVRAALRRLWLRSRERAAALKRDGYRCQGCHRKQSRSKEAPFQVEVHHIDGITGWDKVIDLIYQEILCPIDRLETQCPTCHDEKEAAK